MSFADEVLAEHTKDEPDPNWPNFPERCAKDWELWPCEAVRLATSLRAAEKVVTAAQELAADNERRGLHGAHVLKVKMRLAEYDKGGRGETLH